MEVQQLIPVFVGAILATTAPVITNVALFVMQRKSLKAAFAGEISSIVTILERRDLLGAYVSYLELAKERGRPYPVTFEARRTYTSVFDKNVDKIGSLGPLARDIIKFYSMMNSILEDNTTYAALKQQGEAYQKPENLESFTGLMEDTIEIVRDFLELGRSLNKRLS